MSKAEEKVQIKNIVIQIGKVKATVTVDQAKKLQSTLNELFGAPTTVIERPLIIERDIVNVPYRPFYWYSDDWSTKFTSKTSGATVEFSAKTNEVLCKVDG